MKQSLYQKVYSRPSLKKAWSNLSKNPLSRGITDETIEKFGKKLDINLNLIRNQLKAESYKFGKVRGVKIPKPGKPYEFRPLRVAEVRDRIVIKSIVNVIEPLLEHKLTLKNPASFAYRKNLGPENVFTRIKNLYESGLRVVLEADIIKFFDTVDRQKLLNEFVFPNLPDDSLNELIRNALDVELGNKYKFTPEELHVFESSENGIPQGSSLSPLLSNVYLAIFDKKMLEASFGLVRYADDFVVLCKTDDEAQKAYTLAKSIIEDELNLKLYPLQIDSDDITITTDSKTKIVHPSQNPIKFLSVRYNGQRLWPDMTKMVDLKLKLRELSEDTNIPVKDYLGTFERKLRGWLAAFHFTDVDIYLDKLDFEVSAILSHGLALRGWVLQRQKKTKDGRFVINKKQRTNSGIKHCSSILAEIRSSKVDSDGNTSELKSIAYRD